MSVTEQYGAWGKLPNRFSELQKPIRRMEPFSSQGCFELALGLARPDKQASLCTWEVLRSCSSGLSEQRAPEGPRASSSLTRGRVCWQLHPVPTAKTCLSSCPTGLHLSSNFERPSRLTYRPLKASSVS